MFFYKEKIEVTQEEFDNCQEKIKNAIRRKVDNLKTKFISDIPLTKVDFLVSMKGKTLEKQYGFVFRKTTEEETDVAFAKLLVDIIIVEDNKETQE